MIKSNLSSILSNKNICLIVAHFVTFLIGFFVFTFRTIRRHWLGKWGHLFRVCALIEHFLALIKVPSDKKNATLIENRTNRNRIKRWKPVYLFSIHYCAIVASFSFLIISRSKYKETIHHAK